MQKGYVVGINVVERLNKRCRCFLNNGKPVLYANFQMQYDQYRTKYFPSRDEALEEYPELALPLSERPDTDEHGDLLPFI